MIGMGSSTPSTHVGGNMLKTTKALVVTNETLEVVVDPHKWVALSKHEIELVHLQFL
jgi:hypothetical protein